MNTFRPGIFKVFTVLLFLAFTLACNREEGELHFPKAATNNLDDQLLFDAVQKAEADGGILSLIVYRNNEISDGIPSP